MGRAIATAITLALLLAGGLLRAQETDVSPANGTTPAADSSPAGTDSSKDVAEQTDRQDKGAADPFDYESSEQISEDLSVSFPVDI